MLHVVLNSFPVVAAALRQVADPASGGIFAQASWLQTRLNDAIFIWLAVAFPKSVKRHNTHLQP
jgi:hypothetical protein